MKIAPRKVVNVAVLPSHWQQAILLLPVPVRTMCAIPARNVVYAYMTEWTVEQSHVLVTYTNNGARKPSRIFK